MPSLLDHFDEDVRPLVIHWFEAALQEATAGGAVQRALAEAYRTSILGLCQGDGRARNARRLLRDLVKDEPELVRAYASEVLARVGEDQ